MSANSSGYIAIGFGPGTVHTENSDTYTGYINSAGAAVVIDGSSSTFSIPVYDTIQSISNVTGASVNGVVTISFSRLLNTSDSQDQAITTTPLLVGWAVGPQPSGSGSSVTYPFHKLWHTLTSPVSFVGSNLTSVSAPVQLVDQAVAISYLVDQVAKSVAFTISANSTGYVAIGFGPGPVHTQNSDTYTGYINSAGSAVVIDGNSNTYAIPVYDTVQNVYLVSGSLLNGTMTISFSRRLNTSDSQDQVIGSTPLAVGWAYGGQVTGTAPNITYPFHDLWHTLTTHITFVGTQSTTPTVVPTTAPSTGGPGTTIVDQGFSINYISDQTLGMVNFTISAISTGYIAIGWGPGPVHTQNSDTYTGYINSAGAAVVADGVSSSQDLPTYDSIQSAVAVNGSSAGGVVTISFSRLLNTSDPQDQPISSSLTVGWALGAQPTGSGSQVSYTFHPKYHTLDSKVNFLSSATLPPAPSPSPTTPAPTSSTGSSGGNSFTAGTFSTSWIVNAETITFNIKAQAAYSSIGFGPAGTPAHVATDTYMFWMSTAGVMGTDGFSSTEDTPVADAHQDIMALSGSFNNGILSITFTRKLNTGDSNDFVIGNAFLDLSWAFGPLSNNFPGYHGLAPNRGDVAEINLITGSQIAAPFIIDPALQLIIATVGSSILYLLARIVNRTLKLKKRLDPGDAAKFLEVDDDDARFSAEKYEEAGERGNPSGAYFFRGSVAVAYQSEADEPPSPSAISSKPNSKPKIQHLSKDEIDMAFLSTRAPESVPRSAPANLFSKIAKTRVPKTHTAVWDVVLAVLYLLTNALILFAFNHKSFTPGLTWGYVATANCLLVALPATRNSVLVWLLNIPFDKAIAYHRWIGRLAILQATVHWFFYWGQQGTYQSKYWLGLYSWICMAVLYLTSINVLRRRHFNFFFYSHFAFVPAYVFGALHSVASFRFYAFASAAVYGLDRLIRFFWGVFPIKTVSLEIVSGAIRVRYPKHRLAKYKVGQYVFVNFPQISFLEWHPFTLASGPDEETCELLIKSLGDHTRRLLEAAKNKEDLVMRVDGPYGSWPFRFERYRCIVLVAGGVGVTPSIALLRHVFHIHRKSENEIYPYLSDIFFIWSCKNEQEYSWYKAEVEEAVEKSALKVAKYPALHLHLHITSAQDPENLPSFMKAGRPDLHSIFNHVEKCKVDDRLRAAVVACGPAAMVYEAWDECSQRSNTKERFDFHHETFEF
eukprot:TRINITY_DN5728_c0_g1_i1.p1 TRINITY_DN5728_c0_g1~~TRINITY_DN5728_c0_g1_i1.p1  ORF type:complete len:1218 (+),score=288.28 TRINITY_DN5728_c0_g1_i1:1291-4944(+)